MATFPLAVPATAHPQESVLLADLVDRLDRVHRVDLVGHVTRAVDLAGDPTVHAPELNTTIVELFEFQ